VGEARERQTRTIGRYVLCDEIAAGGMATVHFGRLVGPVGFSRTVAIKRLHPQFAKDPEFVSMFVDEARLAARIRHPNVVQTLDVVTTEGELFVVMDYVQGESLGRLLRASRDQTIPPRVLASIVCGALHGLHAAHEATDEHGQRLGIVHRDMSPQNLLVGSDGVARVLDFGVAKAAGRVQTTKQGRIKGKLGYMAPEQLQGEATRKSDVFAMGVILWEALTRRRLFVGEGPAETVHKIMTLAIEPPSSFERDLPPGIDRIVLRALDRDAELRYATARDMAVELEDCVGLASPMQVGGWVDSLAYAVLSKRAAAIAEIESASSRIVDLGTLHSLRPEALHGSATGASGAAGDGLLRAPPASAPSPPPTALSTSALVWPQRPAPRRRGLVFAAVGVTAATLLVAASFTVARRPRAGAVSPYAASSSLAPPLASEPLSSSTAMASAPEPPPAAAPSDVAAVLPAATPPSASTAAVASSSAPAAPVAPARPVWTGRVVPRARPAVDCDPPYTLDGQGHKHWKDACFRR
jgi:serine/threonine-protein kinase